MKPLYLDIGNSNVKAAEFTDAGWELVFSKSIWQTDELAGYLQKISSRVILVCSVRREISKKLEQQLPEFKFRFIRHSDIPGECINYKTPKTLGIDRFLACAGAVAKTSQPAVVVDAGSACTVDFMTHEFVFQGGVILPGLKVLKQSFKQELPELPVPDSEIPAEWPGKSTEDSIRWGIYGGYRAVLQKFIRKFKEEYPNSIVHLTGGDAFTVQKLFGAEEEFSVNPYLLFEGMKEAAERWL